MRIIFDIPEISGEVVSLDHKPPVFCNIALHLAAVSPPCLWRLAGEFRSSKSNHVGANDKYVFDLIRFQIVCSPLELQLPIERVV